MEIEARGLIYDSRSRPPAERIAFFTSLCLLRNGDILAGFQIGSHKHAPDGTIRLCRSTDGGDTWHESPFRFETTKDGIPGSLAAVEMVEVRSGRLLLFTTWFDRTDPERPLFDPVTEGILRSRQLMAVSADDGKTWGPWRELPTGTLKGCATTGPILSWPDGTIAYAFESFKEFDDPGPGRHAAWLLASRDDGEHFEEPLQVAQHPQHALYYWDQRLCTVGPSVARPKTRHSALETGSGGKNEKHEFFGMFWTHDLPAKRDRHVHQLRGAVDGLAIRSLPVETTIPGQIAAPLWYDLQKSTVLAFVVDRDVPGTMTLWKSTDAGGSWPAAERMVVHQHFEQAALTQGRENIDFKAYWEDMGKWTFGHPAIRKLADGRVLVAYYAGTPESTSIHWARIVVD